MNPDEQEYARLDEPPRSAGNIVSLIQLLLSQVKKTSGSQCTYHQVSNPLGIAECFSVCQIPHSIIVFLGEPRDSPYLQRQDSPPGIRTTFPSLAMSFYSLARSVPSGETSER